MNGTRKKKKMRLSWDDRIFYCVIYVLLSLILILILYPVIYILSSSFSSAAAVTTGKVVLWPVDFSLDGYITVFKNKDIYTGYYNTLIYTIVGTFMNIAMTLIAAYPMARPNLFGIRVITSMFVFTMIFSGGMIPTYILIKDLQMIDTRWAMIIPGAIAVYNLMIAKTFIQTSIPGELLESSRIDGCSDFTYFFRIVLPLSKSLIAVLAIFYSIEHWNSYFNAFLYLNTRNLYPLQIFLREVLLMNQVDPTLILDSELIAARQGLIDLLKYSLIVVSTAPILCVYPFAQKYFVKGVMIGSLKG